MKKNLIKIIGSITFLFGVVGCEAEENVTTSTPTSVPSTTTEESVPEEIDPLEDYKTEAYIKLDNYLSELPDDVYTEGSNIVAQYQQLIDDSIDKGRIDNLVVNCMQKLDELVAKAKLQPYIDEAIDEIDSYKAAVLNYSGLSSALKDRVDKLRIQYKNLITAAKNITYISEKQFDYQQQLTALIMGRDLDEEKETAKSEAEFFEKDEIEEFNGFDVQRDWKPDTTKGETEDDIPTEDDEIEAWRKTTKYGKDYLPLLEKCKEDIDNAPSIDKDIGTSKCINTILKEFYQQVLAMINTTPLDFRTNFYAYSALEDDLDDGEEVQPDFCLKIKERSASFSTHIEDFDNEIFDTVRQGKELSYHLENNVVDWISFQGLDGAEYKLSKVTDANPIASTIKLPIQTSTVTFIMEEGSVVLDPTDDKTVTGFTKATNPNIFYLVNKGPDQEKIIVTNSIECSVNPSSGFPKTKQTFGSADRVAQATRYDQNKNLLESIDVDFHNVHYLNGSFCFDAINGTKEEDQNNSYCYTTNPTKDKITKIDIVTPKVDMDNVPYFKVTFSNEADGLNQHFELTRDDIDSGEAQMYVKSSTLTFTNDFEDDEIKYFNISVDNGIVDKSNDVFYNSLINKIIIYFD